MASTSHLHCDRGVRIPPVVHQRYWNSIYMYLYINQVVESSGITRRAILWLAALPQMRYYRGIAQLVQSICLTNRESVVRIHVLRQTSSQEVRVTSCFQLIWIEHKFWVLKAVGSNPTKYFQDTLLAFLLLILWVLSDSGQHGSFASFKHQFDSGRIHSKGIFVKRYQK